MKCNFKNKTIVSELSIFTSTQYSGYEKKENSEKDKIKNPSRKSNDQPHKKNKNCRLNNNSTRGNNSNK